MAVGVCIGTVLIVLFFIPLILWIIAYEHEDSEFYSVTQKIILHCYSMFLFLSGTCDPSFLSRRDLFVSALSVSIFTITILVMTGVILASMLLNSIRRKHVGTLYLIGLPV